MSCRPYPPVNFIDSDNWQPYTKLIPANEVYEWISLQIIRDGGSIHNHDHAHLIDANIRVMWASSAFTKKGRSVLGQAEEVAFRAGGWQKARMEQQMYEWFGEVPDYIITLAADYCAECGDAEFCALVEHELYHIAQKADEFGAPEFTREGQPNLTLRGHDVEEFNGVVRRYGASADVQELINAAAQPAEVANIDIARACGTCLMKLA